MQKLLALAVTIIFGVTLGACQGDSVTAPAQSASASTNGPNQPVKQSADLFAVDLDPGDAITYPSGPAGTMTLNRRLNSESLSWQLKTAAFEPGHAYTVWIGNFTESAHDGGWGAGGLVGGNGQFTASGNDCVWPLVTFTDGGFRPGTRADCDKIDVAGPITVFVLDHRDWEPGDMLERWDPNGVEDEGSETPTALAGFLVASFEEVTD